VIILTARAAQEDKITGLETGADDYIAKPFDVQELRVRVKNLIEQRRNLRERFNREALFPATELAFTSTDSQFLQKVVDIIDQHIDDTEFTIEMLGERMGMSRMQLHRKIKALTDQSAHNFIRLIRLKKAAVLLKDRSRNITQVTYAVGFKNLSHFARAFKDQFGQNPSQFSNQN
jgi:AraC-like DNA-binding protein